MRLILDTKQKSVLFWRINQPNFYDLINALVAKLQKKPCQDTQYSEMAVGARKSLIHLP